MVKEQATNHSLPKTDGKKNNITPIIAEIADEEKKPDEHSKKIVNDYKEAREQIKNIADSWSNLKPETIKELLHGIDPDRMMELIRAEEKKKVQEADATRLADETKRITDEYKTVRQAMKEAVDKWSSITPKTLNGNIQLNRILEMMEPKENTVKNDPDANDKVLSISNTLVHNKEAQERLASRVKGNAASGRIDNTASMFDNILDNISGLHCRKNKDYGDAWHIEFQEFGPIVGVLRLYEKVNRLKSLYKNNKAECTDESFEDTLMDIASYAVMTLEELGKMKKEKTA